MTKRLIEEWMPVAALGEESVRERRSMTALPPTYYLHVWWARRPLVASRAAVLASVLPADADREKFMHALGIFGDPVATRKRIDEAKRTGENLGTDVYGYKRAFSHSPTSEELSWISSEAERAGMRDPIVLDPTAGGGSIPFEANRLGLESHANDLNPVASLILRQTAEAPAMRGPDVLAAYDRLQARFIELAPGRYGGVFPPEPDDNRVDGYLWARTITCPYCEGLIPLSPNWRLAKDGTGVRLIPDLQTRRCTFEIVTDTSEQSEGTVARGNALCPYPDCGRAVGGDEVKAQAQAGDMGEQLFAVVYKSRTLTKTKTGNGREKWVRGYRATRPEDDNSEAVRERLEVKLPEWETLDIVPSEHIPDGLKTSELQRYGMLRWTDLFSRRQLLCHGLAVEVFRKLLEEEAANRLDDATKAAFVYLSFALDKLLNWNSRLSSWNVNFGRLRSTFDRHDFAFKWSFAEMSPIGTGLGFKWTFDTTRKCIVELINLARPDIDKKSLKAPLHVSEPTQTSLLNEPPAFTPAAVTVTNRSGDNLQHLADHSIDVVVMDPPYYDNVMYAELSDFFYVWLKRTAGYIYPEFFTRRLADKENEAVANPSLFSGQKGARVFAGRQYQDRMARIFHECHRVLKDDGIMTLMFTHKATGAWDALASGLLEAGFTITASWPISTEFSNSIHIREKAAATSTIFLVCRPRPAREETETAYWEDVEPLVGEVVRRKVQEFQDAGISGVDLYLSCFGPALEELAKHWPLTRGTPKPIPTGPRQKVLFPEPFDPYAVTPEDALDAARREVKAWRMEQLLHTTRRSKLDAATEWFVLAWDAFRAPQFPYDEGLRLAQVVGVDLDKEIVGRLAEKKASNLILWDSTMRAKKGSLGAPDGSRGMIDAVHHAANRVRNQSLDAGRELLDASGASQNPTFSTALQAVLEVLPVSSTFTGFVEKGLVGEAANDFDALEHLRRLAFTDRVSEPEQLRLWKG